jgi:hypothetical protein
VKNTNPNSRHTWERHFNEDIDKGMKNPQALRNNILHNPHNVNVVYVRVDNMQEDLQSAVDEYGIKIKIEPKNVSKERANKPYWYYYDKWPKTIKIVEEKYKYYIDKFKWKYKG